MMTQFAYPAAFYPFVIHTTLLEQHKSHSCSVWAPSGFESCGMDVMNISLTRFGAGLWLVSLHRSPSKVNVGVVMLATYSNPLPNCNVTIGRPKKAIRYS